MLMADTSKLVVEPSKELVFEGPCNAVLPAYIKLHNQNDYPVAFKVKTTAPKMYTVRPSSGTLDVGDILEVVVMLQPLVYDQTEFKSPHKFMIQSLKVAAGVSYTQKEMEEMWKTLRSEVVDKKLVCVLRFPGRLSTDPQALTFQNTRDESCVNLSVKNSTSDRTFFEMNSSSEFVSLKPSTGLVEPNTVTHVVATTTKRNFEGEHYVTLRSVILEKEAIINQDDDGKNKLLLQMNSPTFILRLRISFGSSETQTTVVPETHSPVTAVPQTTKKPQESEYLDEIMRLKNENKALKESDIVYRRAALSETCVGQQGPGVTEGGTAIGTIAGIPIILFLILILIIGLILGKYVL